MSNNGWHVFRSAQADLVKANLRIQNPDYRLSGIEATSRDWPDKQDMRLVRMLTSMIKKMEEQLAIELPSGN